MSTLSEYQEKRDEASKKLIEDFSNLVNNFSFEPDSFIEAFSRQHRTLQQNMFRVIINLVISVSKDSYATDGRNEQSKAMAKKLIAGYALITKEEEKQRMLKQGCGEEFSEKQAEEYRVQINESPEAYIGLGHI
jgi:hypothetical protein